MHFLWIRMTHGWKDIQTPPTSSFTCMEHAVRVFTVFYQDFYISIMVSGSLIMMPQVGVTRHI
jgi:hypothetical protein